MNILKKRRTREHVISDLCVNHVERRILRCGWIAQRINPDYGMDLFMRTFDINGEVENGQVWFQLKATDVLKVLRKRQAIALSLEWRDLLYWLNEDLPVVLVIYDAISDRAWWLDVQKIVRGIRPTTATVTLHIPLANVLDEDAIQHFATLRDAALEGKR